MVEPIVFRDDITIKVDEDGVAFTLGARDFKGVQCIVQNVTGTLSPGAHAGSYNGQDAYNDMLVVEDGKRFCSPEVRSIQGITDCVNSETEGLQGCDRHYSEGGVSNE